MMPGPNYIFQCPNCPNLISRESLMSGNTFGAKLYSDGKRIAPMLPEIPNLTQCKKCKHIFWLEKLESIGTCEYYDTDKPEWVNADEAEFLDIKELFKALALKVYENTNEEIFIRQSIWWAYNDRIRENDELKLFENAEDEMLWEINLRSLLDLLKFSGNNHHIIMKAEIERNLGDFEGCQRTLQSIEGSDFDWIKNILIKECLSKNNLVVQVN